VIRFFVPGKPSPKARARTTKRGITYTPKTTQLAEGKVLEHFLKAYDGEPLEGALRIDVYAVFEVPKSWSKKRKAEAVWHTARPDIDNIVKLVTDALNGSAYKDDSQIAAMGAMKCYGEHEGLRVIVREL